MRKARKSARLLLGVHQYVLVHEAEFLAENLKYTNDAWEYYWGWMDLDTGKLLEDISGCPNACCSNPETAIREALAGRIYGLNPSDLEWQE